MGGIKFNTNGFRGVIADNFTKRNVQKIAYALTKVFDIKFQTIAIGYDSSFLGDCFAKWVSEVLVAYGYDVKFFKEPTPSALIAYETKNRMFGVHITAGHNLNYYSGIRIFIDGGREITKQISDKIERIVNRISFVKIKTINFDEAVKLKQILLTKNFKPYCNSILKLIKKDNIKDSKLKVLFNNIYGSSFECIDYIFNKLGITYEIMNSGKDSHCGEKISVPYVNNFYNQIKILKKKKFDVGFAVDSDSDRITFIDKDGTIYDCNYISAVIYKYFLIHHKEGDFVKNCALTELVSKLAKKYNKKTYNANVGFGNVARSMLVHNQAIIGAETNGMIIQGHILYKDGLMCATILIEILASTGSTIKQLVEELKRELNFPCYAMEFAYPITDEKKLKINKKLFIDKKLPITERKILKIEYGDGVKFIYENGYWGVIRLSENENVVKIFAEMQNKKECEHYINTYEYFINVYQR